MTRERTGLRRAWAITRETTSTFPILPALVTALLLGFSIYASFQGESSSFAEVRSTVRELRSLDEVARATPPLPTPRVTCDTASAHYRGVVLQSGAGHISGTADACRQQCEKSVECNAWKWCDDHHNCRDERGSLIPYHGCQLKREALAPSGLPSNMSEFQRREMPRQHTTGFIARRNEKQSTFLRAQSAPGVKMLIATYVPPSECTTPEGTQTALMGIWNKHDYAHWHNYMFRLETTTADPTLRPQGSQDEGSWNKIGILRKLLDAYSPAEAEWILWMEPDAIFDDPSFTIPFEFYQGRDVITVASPQMAAQGDLDALSTGTMLLRNSKWTRTLLDELAEVAKKLGPKGRIQGDRGEAVSDPVAAAMMRILKARGLVQSLTHFRFEGEFCMSCDWRRIDLFLSSQVKRTTVWGEENKRWKLFITRFYDCETCWTAEPTSRNVTACIQAFRRHYEFAYCRFLRNSLAIQREAKSGTFLDNLEAWQIPAEGFNVTAFNQPLPAQATQIVSPDRFNVASAQECYQACIGEQRCGGWIWCNHREGCDDSGTFRGTFPYHGCQLSTLNPASSPYTWSRGPQFSTSSSGYISADHSSRVGWAGRLSRQVSSSTQRVAFATGLPTAPCSTPYGDLVVRLAIQNRQDYVRLHSHEYHLMAQSVDPHLRMGAWQKLGFMRQLLKEIPRERAEWVIWNDMDIIIDDFAFELPLSNYDGKDFVIWGREDKISQGDVLNGVNSGVFAMRNTDWSREFLDMWVPFGAFPPNTTYDEMLRDKIVNFDIGMFEQNVIAYLVMEQPDLLKHIHFEGDYCFNCWYKDAFQSDTIPQPPFVVHFAGCQVCTGFHPEKLNECERTLVGTYLDSHSQLRDIVAAKAVSLPAAQRRAKRAKQSI